MAWGSNEAVPFYRLVPPEVPKPDNTGAEIISRGTQTALQALTSMAALRQRADLAAREQVFEAGKSAINFQIERDKMANDFELHKMLYGVYQTNAESGKIRASTALQKLVQTNQDAADMDAQISKLNTDVSTRAKELKLDDPEFQTKKPIEFAAALQKIRDEFPQAPGYTGIPARFAQWQTIADQQKVYLPLGARYDADQGKWVGGTGATPVPIWKVVKGLQDPNESDMWRNALVAGGHITVDEKQQPLPDKRNAWQKFAPSILGGMDVQTETIKTEKKDPLAKRVTEAAGKVDFSRSESRMKTFVPRETRAQATKFGDTIYSPGGTQAGQLQSQEAIDEAQQRLDTETSIPPEVNTPALPDTSMVQPTATDKTLAQARAALQRNPAARDEILRRLAGLKIDPGLLDVAA